VSDPAERHWSICWIPAK